MPITAITPAAFLSTAAHRGITIEIRGAILTLSHRCETTPHGFATAESEVGLIYEAPQSRAGSTWGTDGGSIGGLAALRSGRMVLHRSGVNRRWLAALARLMTTAP